jgi:selenocysteine-specific translation elongation factor
VALLDGITAGVFGTEQEVKSIFESAVAKKSEAEGILVYTRTEAGRRYSLLDTSDYPDKIQGYARIASMVDHALYFYPRSGKLTPRDGELAVLLSSFGIPGTLELLDGAAQDSAKASLKGTIVSNYAIDERQVQSSAVDLSRASPRGDFPTKGTLVYVDRVFTVKGVGTVALGFLLSGSVSIHDQLRPIPGPAELRADVKGIQVNDVDVESAGRGIRVGLSLRGVEPKDLERSHWLDDCSLALTDVPTFEVQKSAYYKQELESRDLHLQLPGEMVPASLSADAGGRVKAKLPWQIPVWEGMKAGIIDLNGGNLRVAGGANCKF